MRTQSALLNTKFLAGKGMPAQRLPKGRVANARAAVFLRAGWFMKSVGIAFSCGLLALSEGLYAQTNKVDDAYDFLQLKDYTKARQAIDAAAAHATTQQEARTWYYRGVIYKEIYKTSEKTNPRSPARDTALASYRRAMVLDKPGEFLDYNKGDIKFLATTWYNDGTAAINRKDFAAASQAFRMYLRYVAPVAPDAILPDAYFFVGYAASNLNQPDTAKVYYLKAKEAKYQQPQLYSQLASLYLRQRDTTKSLAALKEGLGRFADNKDLMVAEVNTLMAMSRVAETESKVEKLVKLYPQNVEMRLVLGTVYQKMAKMRPERKVEYFGKAKQLYQAVLQLEPNNYQANYNLGVTLFNQGVDIANSVAYNLELEKLDKIQDQCIAYFREALPYAEKASSLNPKERTPLVALKEIYQNLNQPEKSIEIRNRLDKLK